MFTMCCVHGVKKRTSDVLELVRDSFEPPCKCWEQIPRPLLCKSLSHFLVYSFCDSLELTRAVCLCDHGFGAIHWRLLGSAEDTHLKVVISFSLDLSLVL